MKDIPMFTTEYGAASLILRELPYRGIAYVRLQATEQPEKLLEECIGFCRACGAEKIYATGDPHLEQFPLHTAIVLLQCPRENLGTTEATLCPVVPDTLEQWCNIYNERMRRVPNAAYMRISEAQGLRNDGYFIHRDGICIGIGKACDGKIDAVISLAPGAGADCVRALCALTKEGAVTLEVATANEKAMGLYKKLGFTQKQELSRWFAVYAAE